MHVNVSQDDFEWSYSKFVQAFPMTQWVHFDGQTSNVKAIAKLIVFKWMVAW